MHTHAHRVDRGYTSSLVAYDLEVELEDAALERLKATMSSSTTTTTTTTTSTASTSAPDHLAAPLRRDLIALDERIAALLTAIHACKSKRDFMRAFAADPVGFLHDWVKSQARDLDVVFADGAAGGVSGRMSVEEGRRGAFYDTRFAQAAIFHYLNQKEY
jgi:hypothetical protein